MTNTHATGHQQQQQGQPQNGGQPQQPPSGDGGTEQFRNTNDIPSLSQSCMQVIRGFERNEKDKVSALLEIQTLLAGANLPQQSLAQSLSLYLRLLDSIERKRNDAAERGEGGDTSTPTPAQKRAHEEEEGSEEGSETRGTSRRKIDETVLPWLNRASLSQKVNLSESLEKTRVILANLAREPKYACSTIQSQPDCPIFSSEDWDDIVSGKPARFDHIFSSMHATTLDERQTQKVGEVEFKFGPPVAGKKVSTSGDWQIVFAKYTKALTFVFPHRVDELQKYAEHIIRLFGALPETDHYKVIDYDKAIRYRVSQSRQYELTDFSEFQDIFMHWIQAPPSKTRESGKKDNKPRKREPCRHYNEGRCPNTAQSCGYQHICSKCNKNDHTRPNCPT